MIWLKRLSPLLAAALIWFGYTSWTDYQTSKQQAEENRLSLTIAKVWIATALYRDNPVRYAEFQDSVLSASNLTQDELFDYIRRFDGKEEEALPFARSIQKKVDSLHAIEIKRIGEAKAAADSVAGDLIQRL